MLATGMAMGSRKLVRNSRPRRVSEPSRRRATARTPSASSRLTASSSGTQVHTNRAVFLAASRKALLPSTDR